MKKIYAFLLLLSLLAFNFPHRAFAEGEYDPMARNLVYLQGDAELAVPVDGFELKFSWEVDKESFDKGREVTAQTIEKIRKNVTALGTAKVEIIHGWDVVRQARISFGAKGRKLTNAVSVRVTGFPEGKLYEWITKIIDSTLAADSNIELQDLEVFLSGAKEQAARREVTAQAVKNLKDNAATSIGALGKSVTGPKQIFVSGEAPVPMGRAAGYGGDGMYQEKIALRSAVNIQKSFKVQAQIADQIKLNARVTGVYEMN